MRKAKMLYLLFSLVMILTVGSIHLFFSSCGTVGKHAIWGSGGAAGGSTGQPPILATSSYKLTGVSAQIPEFSFGYYNNNFEPFKFINLNIRAGFSFVPLNYTPSNFQNRINNKKIIIFGTGWRFLSDTSKDVFWVGKIVDNPPTIIQFQSQNQNYKTIGGTNFVARFSGSFSSNFEPNSISLFKSNNQTLYTLNDFNAIGEDFRSVAFKVDGQSYAGSIVGRNVTFYSSTSFSISLTLWQNAINNQNINETNTPREFIAFDVVQLGVTPVSLVIVGSDIAELRGELRSFQTNTWSLNGLEFLSYLIGPNQYPLYSSDYVSSPNDASVISASIFVGRNLLLFWQDDGDGSFEFSSDRIIYHMFNQNNPVNLYGASIIKDANNNRFVIVGYDEVAQKGVVYRGTATSNSNIGPISSPPTPVDLSGLGLNLKDTIFFDVATVGENVIVVGVDLTNCPIKPYTIPKLTKSLIFPATIPDNDIINTFTNMGGVILFSNNAGQTFSNFSILLR